MSEVRLSAGASQLCVSPDRGARWTSLRASGHELLTSVAVADVLPTFLSGCYPMAPFAGRLREGALEWRGTTHRLPVNAPPHAMHGTVLDERWDVVAHTDRALELATNLARPWPFAGVVRQTLELAEGSLRARLQLDAHEDMPATVGFHPWFRRRLDVGGDAVLEPPSTQLLERGRDRLPTGRAVSAGPGPWDDCFVGGRAAAVTWPGVLRLELRSTHDHWVLFDELPGAVCVEPQTGPPNAVATGEGCELPGGTALALEVTLSWSLLARHGTG